jgi:hypothetical protein
MSKRISKIRREIKDLEEQNKTMFYSQGEVARSIH